ncbi:MAG: hypothetical protein IPK53_09110 [bacterium]|nr:hypothetical protein [bacterium]
MVADIAFPTTAVRAAGAERWARWWDEDEFYWAADEAIACRGRGWVVADVSAGFPCAGVFTVQGGKRPFIPPGTNDTDER